MRINNLSVLVLTSLLTVPAGCTSGGEPVEGKYELYSSAEYLGVWQVTLLKGRCLARLVIADQSGAAEVAILGFARHVAAQIPRDGAAPADDSALAALVPGDPLAAELTDWQVAAGGAWIVTSHAFDWINGAGGPFDDNGFEAVCGDSYVHAARGWNLELELVNMSDPVGAEIAFRGIGWDSGIRHD